MFPRQAASTEFFLIRKQPVAPDRRDRAAHDDPLEDTGTALEEARRPVRRPRLVRQGAEHHGGVVDRPLIQPGDGDTRCSRRS